VLNNAYTDILDEIIEDYSTKTRVIYEMEFETGAAKGAGNNANGTGADGTAEGAAGDSAANTDGQRAEGSLTSESFTVLISGIDVRGSISTTSRSDVNILMTVNPKTHQILLTTTPRDYYVYIPEVSGDMRDKLTHAGIYGVDASMRTLGNLYGVEVNDYIRINFDSVIRLVDALGGVDVNSDYAFTTRGGAYSFNEGLNHLNGEQALAFSRERYAFTDGDNQRGRNQMAVLTAMINKLQSPALLRNPGEVLEVVGESMQTSFTRSEITNLIAWQLSEGKGWEITRQAVSGHGDSQQTYSMRGRNLYVMWPDEESVAEASEKIREISEGQ
jgi:LCP family protein required for cell wall assembly